MITCTFENGNTASLRHVVVDAIAINDNQQVLLTKRAPHLTRGGFFTVPGGFVDRDESTEQAVLRELKEETGYEGKIVSLFQINDSPDRPREDRQNIDFVYVVKVISGEQQHNSEVTQIQWYSKDDLPTEEEFAFDHRNAIMRFFEYTHQQYVFPIIGEIKV